MEEDQLVTVLRQILHPRILQFWGLKKRCYLSSNHSGIEASVGGCALFVAALASARLRSQA
jgi:hypothetical protein